jgi:hypothetical protein
LLLDYNFWKFSEFCFSKKLISEVRIPLKCNQQITKIDKMERIRERLLDEVRSTISSVKNLAVGERLK